MRSLARRHAVLLLPMQLESKDRMVKGSVNLPASWTGVSLHFINTTTGQDLGTYNNVVENMTAANPTFKIYNSKDDIFSSAEEQQFQAGSLDPTASQQPVVFYKDTNNPSCLHFATTFDDVGSVRVEIIKNGSVMGYGGTTLTADSDFSSLISTVDNGITNPFPAPVVDPTDPNDPGGSGSSLGLLVAEEPGSLAVSGALDPSKNDPTKLVLPLHTGTALPSANDSDLSLITLRQPTGLTSNVGTVTLTVSAPSSVTLFNSAATHVLANYSVNLAAPAGDLAALATGNAQVWVRGAAANSDVTLTYTYTDANGTVQQTDTVQLSVSTSGAMVWPGDMRNMPLFCGSGGIHGSGMALSLMNLKVWSNVAQTAPPPPSKIKNNNLESKVMLVVWDAFTNQFTAPYLRGVAAGFGGAAYSDANTLGQIIILSVISQNPVGQYYIAKQAYGIADSYYQVYQTLAKLTAAQRQQVLDTLVLSAGIQAAGAIFQWQSLTPGQQQTDIEYAQGYVTGYVDWQIIICLATAGGAEALKGAITTAEAGNAVAVTVPKAIQVIDSAVAVASEVDAADVGLEADAFGKACGEVYPGLNITDGEVIANGLAPLDATNGKTTLEAFTQAVSQYTKGFQWGLVGKNAFIRLSQTLTALGSNATSKAVEGLGGIYGRLVPPSLADQFDGFMLYFKDASGTVNQTNLKNTLEAAKDTGDAYASAVAGGGSPGLPRYFLKGMENTHPTSYRYSNFIPNGDPPTLGVSQNGGWYCTFQNSIRLLQPMTLRSYPRQALRSTALSSLRVV